MKAAYGDMAIMCMHPDGTTEYSIKKHEDIIGDLFLMMCWSQFDAGDSSVKGMVTDMENTYLLTGTDAFMVPDVRMNREKLVNNPFFWNEKKQKMQQSCGGIRGSKTTDLFLKSCTDIRKFSTDEGDCFYFVGTRGDGMDGTIRWAANLHRARMIEGYEQFPDVMFEMMLVPFVKYLGMTTSPYPFKYLHEFERMNGMEAYSESDDEDIGDEEEEPEEIRQMTLLEYLG